MLAINWYVVKDCIALDSSNVSYQVIYMYVA